MLRVISLISLFTLSFVYLYLWKPEFGPIQWVSVEYKEPTYFPWNDTRNYDSICSSVKSYLGKESHRSIIVDGRGGGIGHKYTSISHVIANAINSKRRIKFLLPDAFWRVLDPCLKDVFDGDLSDYKLCSGQSCIKNLHADIDLNKEIGDVDYVSNDFRPPMKYIITDDIMKDMVKHHIISTDDTIDSYERIMMRLQLNPSKDLRSIILQEESRVFKKRPVMGVQLRTAGLLADRQEGVSFIDKEALQLVPDYIYSTLRKFKMESTVKTIYLSSDSVIAENFLFDKIGSNFTILNTTVFYRGHSTGRPNNDILSRAMVDVFMLAQCDVLLTTKGSGFGIIATVLNDSPMKDNIPVERKNCRDQVKRFQKRIK